MEDDSAQQLDIEMALAQGALRRLANRGEGLDQQVVQQFAGLQAFAQPWRSRAQVLVIEAFELFLESVDGMDLLFQAF